MVAVFGFRPRSDGVGAIEFAADAVDYDFSFGKTKYMLRSPDVHFIEADRSRPARQPHRASVKPQKFGETSLFDLEASNPLKSHKTSKGILGKAWHWNHR
jgi:hypothetical protein